MCIICVALFHVFSCELEGVCLVVHAIVSYIFVHFRVSSLLLLFACVCFLHFCVKWRVCCWCSMQMFRALLCRFAVFVVCMLQFGAFSCELEGVVFVFHAIVSYIFVHFHQVHNFCCVHVSFGNVFMYFRSLSLYFILFCPAQHAPMPMHNQVELGDSRLSLRMCMPMSSLHLQW